LGKGTFGKITVRNTGSLMSRAWMAEDLIDTVRETVKFLRKAAAELRNAATNEPDVGQTLRHMADQCEAEASDTAAPGARVLDAAGRRECLMRARKQLINEIGDAVPERSEDEPKEVGGPVMRAAERPTLSTPPPSPSDRIRDNAA
jgi:hypothetical protein